MVFWCKLGGVRGGEVEEDDEGDEEIGVDSSDIARAIRVGSAGHLTYSLG